MVSEDCFRKTVCGTPSYAAPEVLLKTAYIPELIDVWSVGVTLYAMLSGGLPFEGDNAAKQRNRIINYRWSQRSLFSQKLNKLFNCIFVEASKRATLDDLLNSDFQMSYYFDSACFIDSNRDQVLPEESILSMAQKECRMDRRKVIESVKQYRLDRFHAVYYILLKREMEGRKSMENSSLSIFKKQNRNSIKLKSIEQTPPKRSKEVSIAKLSQSVESKGRVRTMEIHCCRPRVEATSNTSRRLLEYKVMQTLYV